MSLRPDHTYLILPKDSPLQGGDGLGIGPILLINPPPDAVPVRLIGVELRDRWLLKSSENNTYNVFVGKGQPNDYKWIIKVVEKDFPRKALYVSNTCEPHDFRIEPAGDKLYHIALFGEDLVLTFDKETDIPQLLFRPANGSDAQLFQVVPIERD